MKKVYVVFKNAAIFFTIVLLTLSCAGIMFDLSETENTIDQRLVGTWVEVERILTRKAKKDGDVWTFNPDGSGSLDWIDRDFLGVMVGTIEFRYTIVGNRIKLKYSPSLLSITSIKARVDNGDYLISDDGRMLFLGKFGKRDVRWSQKFRKKDDVADNSLYK